MRDPTDIPPLRISPLGASVTWGTGSSDGNGYRGLLRQALADAGYTVNMVGFNPHGDMADREAEGYPGLKVREVAGKVARVRRELKPNLFLVNAGANNCLADGDADADAVDADMAGLLDAIWGQDDRETAVVLSALLANGNPEADACARRVSEKYAARAAASASAGFRVVYADMSAITVEDIGEDGTHPTDGGYRKMADAWFAAIRELTDKGWISRAVPIEGIPEDGNDAGHRSSR